MPANSQAGSEGALRGTVTDSTGAMIPGAMVLVENLATSAVRSTYTSDAGFFSLSGLPVTDYKVTISKGGFAKAVTLGVHLDPGQNRELNAALRPGDQQETVTVQSNSVGVELEDSSSSGVITAKQVDNLMLNGRNFQTLAMTVPGVSSTQGANQLGGANTGTYLVVNGQSAQYSVYTIDGIYDQVSGNLTNINILPTLDAIQEFRVLKDNYSAKYGLAGSALFLIQTKNGTNKFHGSAWEYFRNDALDARNYFTISTNKLRQNIFGFGLSGPLFIPKVYNNARNKTFFYAGNEWRRITNGSIALGEAFPQAIRNGDFGASPTRNGSLAIDAAGLQYLSAHGKTNCIRSATSIDPACFDSAAVSLMNAYLPTVNNPANPAANYINQAPVTSSQLDYTYRIDHYITDKELLTGRFLYETANAYTPYNGFSGSPVPALGVNTGYSGLNAVVRLNSTLSSHFNNNFDIAETYNKSFFDSVGGQLPPGVSIQQAFPGADTLNRIPTVSIAGGWTGLGV